MNKLIAKLFIGVHDDFRVAVGGELMTGRNQLLAQFDKIEYFAIE